MEPVRWARLPFGFEPEPLCEETRRIAARPWIAHFNPADFVGDWSGIALRSPSGSPGDLRIPPGCSDFHDTEALDEAPHLRQVLTAFQCQLKSARLLKLRAGSAILEHTDDDLQFDQGELRFHVPIQTSPDVEFVVDRTRLDLRPGECWYIDFSLPHRVHNRGEIDRIHLVIDAHVNPWAREMIAVGLAQPHAARPASEYAALERFRELVFGDPSLQARLKQVAASEFVALCVTAAKERGCELEASEAESALRSARAAWTGAEKFGRGSLS